MNNMTVDDLDGIEFSPAFGEIEFVLAQLEEENDPLGKTEQPQIDWHWVAEQAGEIDRQCHDLRVMLWLARAHMHTDGIGSLVQGLIRIDHLIHQDDATLYPRSEKDLSGVHAAALHWLSTPQCLSEIKTAALSPEHPVTLHQLISGEEANGEETFSFSAQVSAVLAANDHYRQQELPDLKQLLSQARSALERIEDYANRDNESFRLDCRPLHTFMQKAINHLSMLEQGQLVEEDLPGASLAEPAQGKTTVAATARPVDVLIQSRQDVILLLDRILDYFQRQEPSHPAPIFIRRSQEMIGLDFAAIVETMLPESLATLEQFIGKPKFNEDV